MLGALARLMGLQLPAGKAASDETVEMDALGEGASELLRLIHRDVGVDVAAAGSEGHQQFPATGVV